jgi:AcrR family transcriptional regulator
MARVDLMREMAVAEQRGYPAKRRQTKTTEILRQAAALLAERGHQGFRIEDLADRVEMSKGNLYNYFRSKDELLYACEKAATELAYDRVLHELCQSETSDAAGRVRIWVDAHLRFLTEEFPLAWFFIQEDRRLPDEYRAEIKGLRHRYERMVDQLVADGVATGAFAPCEVPSTRNFILGGLNWTATWYVQGRGPAVDALSRQYGDQIVAMLQSGRVGNDR